MAEVTLTSPVTFFPSPVLAHNLALLLDMFLFTHDSVAYLPVLIDMIIIVKFFSTFLADTSL